MSIHQITEAYSMNFKNWMTGTLICAIVHALGLIPAAVQGQDQIPTKEGVNELLGRTAFSPYAGRNYPTRVFWGDTHLHTMVSVDAGTMTRLGQEEAFRFARGEEVTTTHGLRAKLSRPLDFLVISDHAEMYGLMPQLLSGAPELLGTEKGRRWYDALTSGDSEKAFETAMEDRRVALSERATAQERQSGHERLACLHRSGRSVQRTGPLHRSYRL